MIWVQHSDDELPHGGAQWQWVPQLVPVVGELLIHKHYNSAFEQTPLDDELARLNATHITLAGAAANWCIRAAAYAALERGYDLTLVSDAHTTEGMALDDGTQIHASGIIQELNMVMTRLRYPGRTNRIVTAQKLKFADPSV